MLGKGAGDRLAVVPGDHHGGRGLGGGDAGAAGNAEGRQAGTGIGEQAVGVAVVGTGELDHDFAAADRAGEADGGHRRLGAGAGHPHHLR